MSQGYTCKVLNLTTLRLTPQSATATIGSGADGTVTITAAAGDSGNTYSVVVEAGEGVESPLAVALDGSVITVTLATDDNEDPDDAANTATLVAAEIDDLDGFTAEASGEGTGVIGADVALFSGGREALTAFDVARATTLSHREVLAIERGEPTRYLDAQRIADLFGVSFEALGVEAF